MKYAFKVTRQMQVDKVDPGTGAVTSAFFSLGDKVTLTQRREKTEMEDTLSTITGKITDWEVDSYNGATERCVNVTILTDTGEVKVQTNNIDSIAVVA